MLSTILDLEANPFLSVLKRVDSAVAGFHGRIVTLGTAFTGIRSLVDMVAGVFQKFTSVIDLGGELTDLSTESGEAAGNLLIFQRMLANTRAGAEGTGALLGCWQKALAGVNEEGKPTTKVLKDLGLASEDLVGKNVLDQVKLLGERFRAIEDPAKRAALAQQLFGGKGQKFLGVLNDPGALDQARTQVGGLAGLMEKLAPTLDTIGDALGGVTLKFQQLTGGALSVVAPQAEGFADALNRIDLTQVGVAIGYVALAVIKVAQAIQFAAPFVLALGAGWLASAAAAQIASVTIVGAVTRVAVATVASVRAIMASLGPLGIAIALVTWLWMKWQGQKAPTIDIPGVTTPAKKDPQGLDTGLDKLKVSKLTEQGLNAYGGGGPDPVSSRLDRTNSLLEQVRDALRSGSSLATPMNRPDVNV